jgi:hypothetical protein
MSIKRCEHRISINSAFLRKVLSSAKVTFEDSKTKVEFYNDMSPQSLKEFANWIITQSINNTTSNDAIIRK